MHVATLSAWLCMEAARCRDMAKEGVALTKVKGKNLERGTDHSKGSGGS